MKILHALNHFLPHHIAGTEMYVYALAKAMGKSDFESVVIIPNYGTRENEEYIFENIRVIKYAEPSIVDRDLQMGKRKPDGLGAFIDIIEREEPDVIHFHELAGSNGITLHHVKAAKEAGCKVVMTFHLARYSCKTGTLMYKNEVPCDGIIDIKKCTLCCYHVNGLSNTKSSLLFPLANVLHKLNVDASEWESRFGTAFGYPFIIEKLKKNLNLLAGDCDKMVVLSKWYQDVLLRNGIEEKKMKFIQQGVFKFTDNPNQKAKAGLPLKVIFVGRISHFKGVKMLIDAAKKLHAEKIQLDIYGDSGDKEYMDECRKDTTGMKNISWKGRLPPDQVIPTMNQYDLLCLPSTVCEMSPLVIQEAFAAGVPVLATDVYGNAEQITHDVNGWLFKFNDVDGLTNQIQKLIDDPSLIEESKQHIPVVTSFEHIAGEYAALYKTLY